MQTRKHIVRPGESLSSIAHRELGSARQWPQLFAFNTGPRARFGAPLSDPNQLHAGQALAIPPRIASRRPYLPRHPDLRHPMQQTHPVIPPMTAPAQAAAAQPAPTRLGPVQPPPPPQGAASRLSGITLVNSPAFKFDLDLAPAIKRHTPVFDYEIKFQGQITIWTDQQVDILTFTNKGFESAAKAQAGDKLMNLLTSEKVKFDEASKKVSFESLLTNGAVGQPLAEIQVGTVIDTSDPRPAIRLKLAGTDKLMGRLLPGTLWVAEKLEITVDVRLNVTAGGAQSVARGVVPDTSEARARGLAPDVSSNSVAGSPDQPPDWTKSRWAPLFFVVITAGVLATNVLAWGMRAPVTGSGALMLPGGSGADRI